MPLSDARTSPPPHPATPSPTQATHQRGAPPARGPVDTHTGTLCVGVGPTPRVGQPNPRSNGRTVVTEQARIKIGQDDGWLIQMGPAAQLAVVVKDLNALGATPQDLLAILQAMRSAGALKAEIEVI